MYRQLLYGATALALISSCAHDTDKPVEQPDTTAQVSTPPPSPGGEMAPEQVWPADTTKPARQDNTQTKEPERIVQKGPAPEEKGDIAPKQFLGTKGTFSKEASSQLTMSTLREVRSAQHPHFDRITFEFGDTLGPGYHIGYIDQPQDCGTGRNAKIEGNGWIEVRFTPARAHTDNGKPTINRREYKFGYPVIREVERTCDFEGTVTYVIGVASPNKFRVIELKDPPRVSIDIDQ